MLALCFMHDTCQWRDADSEAAVQAPARRIASISKDTPSSTAKAHAAWAAWLLTDIWLRHQAQRQSAAKSDNAAASCGAPDLASAPAGNQKVLSTLNSSPRSSRSPEKCTVP